MRLILHLQFWSDNGGAYRAKIIPLLRVSILYRPHKNDLTSSRLWWRRRVPPPGPLRLFCKTFIAIVSFLTSIL